jgi:hypothetical protein
MSDNKKEDASESKSPKIMYLGGDTNYFNLLKERFKELCSQDVTFSMHDSKTNEEVQTNINTIRENRPKIVLVDFSQNEEAKLHVTRVCMRQSYVRPISFLGLADYTQGKSVILKAIMAQMNCVHVKSSELDSIVYDMVVLAFPGKIQEHGFATAELNDAIKAYYPCKASVVNENSIKIESNIPMAQQQQIRLNNYWSRTQVINSNLTMCVDQKQENLYYNYAFSQVMQLAHVDPVAQTDDMTKEIFEEKQAKRTDLIANSKFRFNKWTKEHLQYSKPKFLKAYVIDKEGIFFDERPLSDSYIFVFRVQPYIKNAKHELLTIRPQLVVFNIEDVDEKELTANADIAHTFNDTRMLQHLVKTMREVATGFNPILIIFNAGEHDSNYYQKVLNYPSVLAVKEKMKVDLVVKMAEMLKVKIEPSLPSLNSKDMYIEKNSDISYCEIESDINLIACSENDVFFNSEQQIAHSTVMRISLPVPMYITVVPLLEKTKIQSQYYAIIHGIGEEERQELRRFINDIFFRELETEKGKAAEEVEGLKQKYSSDKVKAETMEEEKKETEDDKEDDKEDELTAQASSLVGELGETEDA